MSTEIACTDSIQNWATSAGGHSIALHKSKGAANAQPILFMGGIHGDEPEGVWLAQLALEILTKNKSKVPWYLITCLNPDGHKKNERMNAHGVDLNRNFPEKNWSPDHKAPRYFPGPKPASEPEVQAFIKLIDEINPKIIIHCHSWKPCIVLTGSQGVEIAKTFSRHTGYEFLHDIGYPTPGSLGEYGWREKGIPVICIEAKEKIPRPELEELFRKPLEEIFLGRV